MHNKTASIDASNQWRGVVFLGLDLHMRHLRNALIHIGLTRAQASVYSAHSLRSGGATEAAAAKLHREDILHLAGVADANWLAYYNRMYLAERLRVSRSLGL